MDRLSTSQLRVVVNKYLRSIIAVFGPNTISNENLWEEIRQLEVRRSGKEHEDGWDKPLERQTLPLRKRLLSGTLRGHKKEVDPLALEEKPLIKKQQQTWGQLRDMVRDRNGWRALLDALCFR